MTSTPDLFPIGHYLLFSDLPVWLLFRAPTPVPSSPCTFVPLETQSKLFFSPSSHLTDPCRTVDSSLFINPCQGVFSFESLSMRSNLLHLPWGFPTVLLQVFFPQKCKVAWFFFIDELSLMPVVFPLPSNLAFFSPSLIPKPLFPQDKSPLLSFWLFSDNQIFLPSSFFFLER